MTVSPLLYHKRAGIGQKTLTKEVVFLAILITSYFYCLPLGRFSIGFFDSDFRIFDFAILMFIAFSLYTGLYKRFFFISNLPIFTRYLKYLLVMIVISLFFFILYSNKIAYILPTLIRLYRAVGYFMTGAAVIAIVNTRKKYKFIFYVILFNITIQGILGFFQGIGVLGSFWPDYWNIMYSNMKSPVATLSPHHKHMGVIMLTGLGLALGLIRYFSKRALITFGALIMCLIFISVPLFAGTRTFLLGFFGFLLGYVYINRSYSFVILISGFIIGAIALAYSGGDIIDRINIKYEEKISSRYDKFGYEGLYGDRSRIYAEIIEVIAREPYLLVTGTGFQNISSFIGANGAHNNYLHVLMELGILGLVVFLKFLYAVHRNLLRTYQLIPSKFIKATSSHIWVSFMGVLATMFVGETIWAQAAMFTLAGQLIALYGLGVAPLVWAFLKQKGVHFAQNSDFI